MSNPTAAIDARTGLLRMFVLDVLRHDEIEQVSSIVRMLNNDGCIGWRDHWGREFTSQEVLEVLGPLTQEGLVQAFRESRERDELLDIGDEPLDGDDVWFHLTDAGRKAWDSWEPPVSPE